MPENGGACSLRASDVTRRSAARRLRSGARLVPLSSRLLFYGTFFWMNGVGRVVNRPHLEVHAPHMVPRDLFRASNWEAREPCFACFRPARASQGLRDTRPTASFFLNTEHKTLTTFSGFGCGSAALWD